MEKIFPKYYIAYFGLCNSFDNGCLFFQNFLSCGFIGTPCSNAARVCGRVVVRMIMVGLETCPSLYNFYQATWDLEPLRKLPDRRKKDKSCQRWRKALARFTMTPYQDPRRVCEEDWEGGGDGAQCQQSYEGDGACHYLLWDHV